ncbi:MAG: preprotein translocase subunit YajC [Pseudomonadota bacterium]
MFISKAYAQEVLTDAAGETAVMVGQAPSATSAFLWNMGLILVLVIMFYFLLIRPQQKRYAAHKEMVDNLKKGDKVVTQGGLIGKIDKIKDDKEVVVDLGKDMKVTAVRSSLSLKEDPAPETTKKA